MFRSFASSRFLRFGPLALLALLIAVSCTDRLPLAPAPDALVSAGGLTYVDITGAFGTAVIDGVVGADWNGASPHRFLVDLTGKKRKDDAVGLYLMNDLSNLYVALEFNQRPAFSDGAIVRVTLINPAGGSSIMELRTGSGADQWAASKSGSLVYEARKQLASLGSPTRVAVRVEILPGGNASPTYFPSNNEFALLPIYGPSGAPLLVADANGPYGGHAHVEVAVTSAGSTPRSQSVTHLWDFGAGFGTDSTHTFTSSGVYEITLKVTDGVGDPVTATTQVVITPTVEVLVEHPLGCSGVTVTARDTTVQNGQGFAARLTGGDCVAGFDLPLSRNYVFSARNTATDRFHVWPLAPGQYESSLTLPRRQGVVCVQQTDLSCDSEAITVAAYLQARTASRTLQGPLDLTLRFQDGGRTIPCTVVGAGPNPVVYAQIPLPSPFQRPGNPPPALGIFIDRAAADGSCVLNGVPEDEFVVVEAIDDAGQVYRGVIGKEGEELLNLIPGPDYVATGILWDDPNDNAAGKEDISLVTYGLVRNTQQMVVRILARSVQENGAAHFQLALSDVSGPGIAVPNSMIVDVVCNKIHPNRCDLVGVTGGAVVNVLGVAGNMKATEVGYVDVSFDFTGIQSARLRVRAGVASGYDFAPDSGFRQWNRDDSGNSFTVSF